MKLLQLILGLSLLFSNINLFGQTNREQLLKIVFPSLPLELQDNIIVLAGLMDASNREQSMPCPPAYTNLLSNTNLFSPAEEQWIKEVALKYKNVTTNSGPAGTVFKEWKTRQMKLSEKLTHTYPVAFFNYTNSSDHEEVVSKYDGQEVIAHYRTPSEDGYDVKLYRGMLMDFQEYKKGVLNGLFIRPNSTSHPNTNFDKCYGYLRFAEGMAVGKYICWDNTGKISSEMEFKKPFDILKYSFAKFDLSWTEVPTNTTNSVPSQK